MTQALGLVLSSHSHLLPGGVGLSLQAGGHPLESAPPYPLDADVPGHSPLTSGPEPAPCLLTFLLFSFSDSRSPNEREHEGKHLTSVPFPLLLYFGNLSLAFTDSFQGLKLTSLPCCLLMPSVLE